MPFSSRSHRVLCLPSSPGFPKEFVDLVRNAEHGLPRKNPSAKKAKTTPSSTIVLTPLRGPYGVIPSGKPPRTKKQPSSSKTSQVENIPPSSFAASQEDTNEPSSADFGEMKSCFHLKYFLQHMPTKFSWPFVGNPGPEALQKDLCTVIQQLKSIFPQSQPQKKPKKSVSWAKRQEWSEEGWSQNRPNILAAILQSQAMPDEPRCNFCASSSCLRLSINYICFLSLFCKGTGGICGGCRFCSNFLTESVCVYLLYLLVFQDALNAKLICALNMMKCFTPATPGTPDFHLLGNSLSPFLQK